MPGKFFEADCRSCGQPILFYSLVVTRRGTWQALDPVTYGNHKCPFERRIKRA